MTKSFFAPLLPFVVLANVTLSFSPVHNRRQSRNKQNSRFRCDKFGQHASPDIFSCHIGDNRIALHAYIIPGPDEQEYTYRSSAIFKDDQDILTSSRTRPQASPDFVEFLNKESAILARLAVAHSPKDRTLNIKNIHQVGVLNVEDDHMEIQAVVCDDVQCVTLAVPVSYPKTCSGKAGSAEFEQCIIENFDEMGSHAFTVVEEAMAREAESQQTRTIHNDAELLAIELKGDKNIIYPDWWEFPLNMALAKDCEAVRSLLNKEQFQYDMHQLLSRISSSSDAVHRVGIAALGPKGMILKAATSTDRSNANNKYEIMHVPLPFSTRVCDYESIQDAVLSILDDGESS